MVPEAMIKRDWKVKFLPFLYRECPSGNAHWRGNHICYCCRGHDRDWTYVWRGDKGWVPTEFVLNTEGIHNSISWSGQLTTFDLVWNGIRTGLLIAIFFIILAYMGFRSIVNSEKNVQSIHGQIAQPSETD